MAQQPIRSEEELCPSDKRVAVNVNNLRLDPDEIHVEPLFNLTLAILKQHSIINAVTLTTEAPEIYMQIRGDDPKKTTDVLRRSQSITITDNLLEDPNQAIALAKKAPGEGLGATPDSPDHSDSFDNSIWDSSDDDKTESVKDSNHGDDTDDYDKYSDAEEDQTTGFGILVHDKEPEQPQLELQPHSPITLTVAPLLASIPEVQEQAHVDQFMDSLPSSTTTITPPTKLKKNQAKKLLKKAIQRQNDSKKAIMHKLEEHEQKLNALA
ncbi:hypothetical protein Tco_1508884 [Tanacetum coccineum]